jgi:hypothetical protein
MMTTEKDPGAAAAARKTMVELTDREWHAVKIAAALDNVSVQTWLTRIVRAELHDEHREALELAEHHEDAARG